MTAQPISCREVLDFLAAYLDDELEGDGRPVFERHLERCPACVSYLESYRETVRLGQVAHADGAIADEIPEELVDAILAGRGAARRTGG